MNPIPYRNALTVGGALTLIMVCVVGTAAGQPLAGTPPSATAATSSATPWAWGGVRVIGLSGTLDGFPYHGSALFGASVIVHQTNLSGHLYALTVTRTAGAFLNLTFCSPTCKSPTVTATLQHHAWEIASVTANVTTAGNVTVAGAGVPAVALLSSNGSVSAFVRETNTLTVRGTLDVQRNLSGDVYGNWSLGLTPALGLVPLNLTSGEAWNSSSAYDLAGLVNWTYGSVETGPLASPTGNVSSSGSQQLNATGTVAIAGLDAGATMRLGGVTYPQINVTITGPFSLREGFLLLPVAADLFASSGQPWETDDGANATASATTVEVLNPVDGPHHLGFVSSGLVWRTFGKNPAGDLGEGVLPLATPAAGAGNATAVQSAPESVTEATAQGGCLARGVGCPSLAGPASPLVREIVIVSLAAGTLIILIALVTERRRIPPPPYPNAALYPPETEAAPNAPTPPSPPIPPNDDDPLSHLW